MATKSKPQSLSARRSSPRTRSGAVPEPISSPHTFSRFVPEPNTSPGTDEIPRTPFSLRAVTPVVGTLKSVSLSDWWLTKKANEKALGVAGFESKGGSEVRLFSSGTISVRHDSTTLETSDGIRVSISGFINRSRSLQNGFSSEVCNRFLLGFPYNWKDQDEEETAEEEKKHFSVSFDDIPVNRIQDLLFTASPCFKSEILDDVVNSLRDLVCPSTEKSDKEIEISRTSNDDDDDDDDESVVPCVVGVKTRGMLRSEILDDVVNSLRDLVCPSTEKSDKKIEISRMSNDHDDGGDDDDESVVPCVVGVKTRGMLRKREENEASIGKRVHTSSKRKRSREKN